MKCVADIQYDSDRDLFLDLYVPETLNAQACVVYAHGGGFAGGSRADHEVLDIAQMFTDYGFALAAIDLRNGVTADDLSPEDAQAVADAMARTERVGLSLPEALYGAGYQAAIEDINQAVSYMRGEAAVLGIGSVRIGVLGSFSGGIAALGLAFEPGHMAGRVTPPAAIATIGAALVQPWRMQPGKPPCLLFASTNDLVVPIDDVRFGQSRADAAGVSFRTVETDIGGPEGQMRVILNETDDDGVPYRDMLLQHFEPLMG